MRSLREFYNWLMNEADTKQFVFGLALVAIGEAVIFSVAIFIVMFTTMTLEDFRIL